MLSLLRQRVTTHLSNNIFLRKILRTCSGRMDMEIEDDGLYSSHQKLKNLIRSKGEESRDEAVVEYLKNLSYPVIKDFTAGLEWFNVSEPLSFKKHLKGKIVVLDFFTYCCINCMHIIPDLREIEHEFSVEDGLVVIGVHSAKFENEKLSENILAAVQRYNIMHPVVNDYKSDMWKNCDISCWPSLLVVGPNANPIVLLMGEGHKENLRLYIRNALKYYKSKNEISHHSLPFSSAFHLLPDLKGPLLFPGKITSIVGDGRKELVAVSDTGNNRILVLDESGTILYEIGGNKIGFKDGNLKDAEFNAPQGIAFRDKDTLYVADTENHAIRKVDLKNKIVETVAGTGEQGTDRFGGKPGKIQEISSPWDICIYRTPDMDMTFYPNGDPPLREVLLIAMAGLHQIWALFLDDTIWWKAKKYTAGTCLAIAGSGKEENRNNQYPQNAAFAQPSGLALCAKNKEVYIADSESSSVRRLSLVDGKVTAVVGGDRNPNNLFAFGDKDGSLCEAKLQHILGLAVKDENTLFVADTYNHKIKKVDLQKNSVVTLSGSDTTDGKEKNFNEPAGLCVSCDGRKLYLADTNNHRIKVMELCDDNTISKVRNVDLKMPQKQKKITTKKLEILKANPVKINMKGGKIIVNINVKLEKGLGITQEAPQGWLVELPGPTWSCVPNSGDDINNIDVVVSVPDNVGNENTANFDFIFHLVTCSNESCLPKNFIVQLPVNFTTSAQTSVTRAVNISLQPSAIRIV